MPHGWGRSSHSYMARGHGMSRARALLILRYYYLTALIIPLCRVVEYMYLVVVLQVDRLHGVDATISRLYIATPDVLIVHAIESAR